MNVAGERERKREREVGTVLRFYGAVCVLMLLCWETKSEEYVCWYAFLLL